MAQHIEERPWYREKWVWFLIAIPSASVIFGIFMLTMAMQSDLAMVNDDYYKEGLAINQTLAREHRAEALGLNGTIALDDSSGRLLVTMDSTIASESEAGRLGHTSSAPALVLEINHPTRENMDAFIQLYAVDSGTAGYGRYESVLSAEVMRNVSGRRYFSVTDSGNTWRITAEGDLSAEDSVGLGKTAP